jgi:ankyrin repeat protein
MPLHKLFANFDKNSHGPADVDALLLKNYNPNQNDQNGLSPYHICIIYNQKKGLQYLL